MQAQLACGAAGEGGGTLKVTCASSSTGIHQRPRLLGLALCAARCLSAKNCPGAATAALTTCRGARSELAQLHSAGDAPSGGKGILCLIILSPVGEAAPTLRSQISRQLQAVWLSNHQ